MLKSLLKRLVPSSVLGAYHFAMARGAAAWYGNPSERLVVIGVTGTSGKSTTVQYIGRLLEHAGCRVGWTSTAGFKVAGKEWENDKKMTMMGRFETQRLLKQMVDAGCTHAIVETSSQGVVQSRHVGINYDVAVFTNLTPEHIEAHGGFENYKKAKGAFFAHVGAGRKKKTGIPKTTVVNVDDPHAAYFLSFPAEARYGYGVEGKTAPSPDVLRVPFVPVIAHSLALSDRGSLFTIDGHAMRLAPLGLFNAYDALAAIAAVRAVGVKYEDIAAGVASLKPVPGRLEFIDGGQGFSVVVDYAYEPASLKACYDALALLKRGRLIQVLGSTGGGRDVSRRAVLGEMAGREADVVVVTNEDPYDDDPKTIVDQVAEGAVRAGKHDGVDLFRVLDRQQAINQAIAAAHSGDLVLITGKGCEPVMAVAGGKYVPWDDRLAARRALSSRP